MDPRPGDASRSSTANGLPRRRSLSKHASHVNRRLMPDAHEMRAAVRVDGPTRGGRFAQGRPQKIFSRLRLDCHELVKVGRFKFRLQSFLVKALRTCDQVVSFG